MKDTKQEVTKVTKDGIELSYKNAGEAWRLAAHQTLEKIAENNQYIVSDMLITALEEAGHGLNNYSALGGVFLRAAKDGYIEKTNSQQMSTRVRSHSAKTVWSSKIYKKAEKVTKDQWGISGLINNALEFNAATVRNASIIFAQGQIKPEYIKREIKRFKQLIDQYNARNVQIIEALEKETK